MKSVLFCIMLVGCLAATSFGADANGLALIDFQTILETSNAGKKAQAEINAEGKKMEADLKEKNDEIKELEKKLELEKMVLSKEARQEKQRDIRIKVNDFKSLQAKYRADIKKLEAKVITQIQEEVFDIIDGIAKDKGYRLVLEKRTGGVLYSLKSMDITALVIEKYDKQVAANAGKAKE